MEPSKATSVISRAEELFVQLFCEAFGPEKTENLQVQYPCVDIYGRHRYIDFALESPESKIAFVFFGVSFFFSNLIFVYKSIIYSGKNPIYIIITS